VRIAIDGRRLSRSRLDGRLSYLKNALTNLLEVDEDNEYEILTDGPVPPGALPSRPNVRVVELARPLGKAGRLWGDWWAVGASSRAVAGCHLPVDPYPLVDRPYVITGHDLTVYEKHYRCGLPLGQYLTIEAMRAYSRLTFGRAARHARVVHCITEEMRRLFVEYLDIDDQRLAVIYPGGDNASFFEMEDEQALADFRRRLGVNRQFFMAFGNKNLEVLLRAYAMLPAHVREQFALVVVGKALLSQAQIEALVSALSLVDHVRVFDRPFTHQQLCWFYNAAALFVLPTQYEMFCNMILEAMRCGCPVLTSPLAANVEVGQDAMAYYGAVNDPASLAEAMRSLAESEATRLALAAKGRQRGGHFTWRQHAEQLRALYTRAFA
jgi:glycosyltransferase involved in cell wall biosynthesis